MKGTMVNVLPALLTLGSQALAQDDAPASGLLPAVADLGSQLLGQDEAPASTHCVCTYVKQMTSANAHSAEHWPMQVSRTG